MHFQLHNIEAETFRVILVQTEISFMTFRGKAGDLKVKARAAVKRSAATLTQM